MNTLQIETKRNVDYNYLPSPRLWASCPWQDIVEGKAPDYRGTTVDFRFGNLKLSTNVNAAEAFWSHDYVLFGSDGAAVAIFDDDGGGATFSSDGDDEGVGLRQVGAPFQIDRGHRAFWAECALRTSTITDTKHGFFFGLRTATAITATAPIAADGTLADNNLAGFHRLEADGDQLDTVYKANGVTQVTVNTDALDGGTYGGGTIPSALAVDTVIRLGLKYTPNGHKKGDHWFSYWVNGIELPDGVTIPTGDGTDFPNDVRMGLTFSLLNATATTPGTTTLLWWRAAQLSVN